MSILDTKHDDTLVDFTLDRDIAIEPFTIGAVEDIVSPVADDRRGARDGGRFAKFFVARRLRNSIKNGVAFFSEPAVYDEYRASMARRDATKEPSLHD